MIQSKNGVKCKTRLGLLGWVMGTTNNTFMQRNEICLIGVLEKKPQLPIIETAIREFSILLAYQVMGHS